MAAALASQAGYVRDALGCPIQPCAQQPAEEEVLDSEDHALGGDEAKAEFKLCLTRPAGGCKPAAAAADGAAAATAALHQQAL